MARFLDARDMKQEALEIATDPDYRFDLAVSLGELDIALQLAEQSGSELKWRQLGELALSAGKLQVLISCHPLPYLWQTLHVLRTEVHYSLKLARAASHRVSCQLLCLADLYRLLHADLLRLDYPPYSKNGTNEACLENIHKL